MLLILVVLLENFTIFAKAQGDYCTLCADHVACNSTGEFYPNCENAQMIRFNKCWIIRKHNEWRDQVAGGKVQNLKPACRMSYMQWDDELAVLAAHNVIHCRFIRDNCLRSVRFRRVAQNLGVISYEGGVPKMKESIKSILTNWYNEINNIQQTDIDINRGDPSSNIAQFTTMMEDGTTRVGCAAATYRDGGGQVFLLVCNYGTRNIIGRPVYEKCDKSCTKCVQSSLQYKNLCSRGEGIFRKFPHKSIKVRFANPWFNPMLNSFWNSPWRSSMYNPLNNTWYDPWNKKWSNPWKDKSPKDWKKMWSNLMSSNLMWTSRMNKTRYVPGYGIHNGAGGSYNNNDNFKNINNDQIANSDSDNIDHSSKGNRMLIFEGGIIEGDMDWGNRNGIKDYTAKSGYK